MIADGTGGAKSRDRRSLRAGRRHEPEPLLSQFTTHVLSIVRQPSPFTLSSIGVPTGPDVGVHLEALRDLDAVLRDRLAVDERDDFVHAAVVFGNREARVEPSARVDGELPERGRGLRVFLAAEVVVVLDHPAARHRSPRELDGLSRGKIRSERVHLSHQRSSPRE